MPRDAAGSYTLVAGNPVLSGTVISSSWANATLNDVSTALTDSLDRYGRGGMLASFRFADGTKLLPSASFVNETSSGLYREDGGDVRMAILTQDVMRWQTSGVQIWDNVLSQWFTVTTTNNSGDLLPLDNTWTGVNTFNDTIVGSISGNAVTVTNGVYTVGDQAIAGVKTFSDNVITNSLKSEKIQIDNGNDYGVLSFGFFDGLGTMIKGYSVDHPSLQETLEFYTGDAVRMRINNSYVEALYGFKSEGAGADSFRAGTDAGATAQGANAVAIGLNAGQTSQGESAVAVGDQAGATTQGAGSTAVGYLAGQTGQLANATAIGRYAGNDTQGAQGVAIGNGSGQTSQGENSVAIGQVSGNTSQGIDSVAVGRRSASNSQGANSVAVGAFAGETSQATNAVAIGSQAGATTQGVNAVAIGITAGGSLQSTNAVAVGRGSGYSSQGAGSVAVGNLAGKTSQGAYAVAIGQQAGETSQHANSIVINSKGTAVNTTGTGDIIIESSLGSYKFNQYGHVFSAGSATFDGNLNLRPQALGSEGGQIVFRNGVDYSPAWNIDCLSTATPNFRIYNGVASTIASLAWTASSWSFSSDINQKDVVGDVENATDMLSGLSTIYFKYKDESNSVPFEDRIVNTGLIAQEVQEVLPCCVDTDEETGILSMRYNDLIAVLVKSNQEMSERITLLTARVEALEA